MLVAHLTRGVKAGVVAGLVFGLFVAAVANPLVAYAAGTDAAVEGGHDHAAGGHGGEDHGTVPAAVTGLASVAAGALWAVLLGGLVFGAGYFLLEPALPGTGATRSYVLGGAGFLTVSGAPWLVLPPAPPGAEQSLPVGTRLALYAGMVLAGALACLLAGLVYDRLRGRGRRVAVAATGAAPALALLAVPAALAPTNAVEASLAPGLRAGLTGLAVFGQLLLWLALATAHARLAPDTAAAAATGPATGRPTGAD